MTMTIATRENGNGNKLEKEGRERVVRVWRCNLVPSGQRRNRRKSCERSVLERQGSGRYLVWVGVGVGGGPRDGPRPRIDEAGLD
jgi:hypothetical protein